MYSFHSSPEEKNKLLSTLAQHGIETTVDRVAKKKRIRDWIQSSVITEEDEENDSGTTTPSSTHSRTPVAGHISSVRAMEQAEKKIISTVKDAANKHIDPRTGIVQQGPSEMCMASHDPSDPDPRQLADNNGLGNRQMINVSSQTSIVGPPSANATDNSAAAIKMSSKAAENGSHALVNGSSFKKNSSIKNAITSTSKGLLTIGNTFATASVPEIQNFSPIERVPNPIMDSGYGSLDKLKPTNGSSNAVLCSPILRKRSTIKSSAPQTIVNDRRHNKRMINSDDDSGGDGSDERGSSGFVNLAGTTMKDTAYDYVKPNKRP